MITGRNDLVQARRLHEYNRAMKTSNCRFRGLGLLMCISVFIAGLSCAAAAPATNDDFSALSKAVVELLQNHDATNFANEMAATVDDWKSIISTNSPAAQEDPAKQFQTSVKFEHDKVEGSGRNFLSKANALHLDFSKGNLNPQVIPPKSFGTVHYPTLQAEGESLTNIQKIEISLSSDLITNDTGKAEFVVVLRNVRRFPGGWRSSGGIEWEKFPDGMAGEGIKQELTLLDKVAAYKGFTSKEDPALSKLGETLVRFLRERDTAIYQKDALMNSDTVWQLMQSMNRKDVTRQQVDDEIKSRTAEQLEAARTVLKQTEDSGIDLKNAEIWVKEASVDRSQSQGPAGSFDGIIAQQFKVVLAVKSDGKSKSGVPLSGEYVLAAKQLTRAGDNWRIDEDLHWDSLPAGVLDEKTVAAMAMESYVSEHGAFPSGTSVPEIEFTTLDGDKKMKLSDLRGKVVVLDFWATWCGPCQEPMAQLQTLRASHPDWTDKVAIIPLSIDDTIDAVRQHIAKRGWTNTFNVWAGDGGWHSSPAQAFRVSGVPTTYIISTDGKVVQAGHPASLDIGGDVDRQLKETSK